MGLVFIPEKSGPCQYMWHFQPKDWFSHLLAVLLDSGIQSSLEYWVLFKYIHRYDKEIILGHRLAVISSM